jgi:hypothetical protein
MKGVHAISGGGLLLWLLSGVAGCGSAGPKTDGAAGPKTNGAATTPDEAYKGVISVQKQAASALAEIKDEASAESTLPKLEKLAALYAELDQQLKGFKLTPDEHGKLIDRHESQAGPASQELSRAARAAKKRAPEHAQRITKLLGKFGMYQTTID